MTHMTKTQIYLPTAELAQLHRLAKQAGRSLADLIREAIRKTWLPQRTADTGPVALWPGAAKRSSNDHDSIYDERP